MLLLLKEMFYKITEIELKTEEKFPFSSNLHLTHMNSHCFMGNIVLPSESRVCDHACIYMLHRKQCLPACLPALHRH